jgi:hypothetical protein
MLFRFDFGFDFGFTLLFHSQSHNLTIHQQQPKSSLTRQQNSVWCGINTAADTIFFQVPQSSLLLPFFFLSSFWD